MFGIKTLISKSLISPTFQKHHIRLIVPLLQYKNFSQEVVHQLIAGE